ncbi:MAG: hypothetical protein CK424_07255 [Legionella sp.]|nr:MAG: hypothetical protein CK424_07255 [Legionella sp.]
MKMRGFILMTVMLMMSVLSLLVLANIRLFTLSLKRHYQWHRYEETTAQLEHATTILAKQFVFHPSKSCLISVKKVQDLKTAILHAGCVFDTKYRYGITDLGSLACVKSSHSQDAISTHHWLLSVMDTHEKQRMIQVRIATPGPQEFCPDTDISVIHPGVLTWRYL